MVKYNVRFLHQSFEISCLEGQRGEKNDRYENTIDRLTTLV